MISLRGQVWAMAEWSESAIQSCALYAEMRIETKGFKFVAFLRTLHIPFGSSRRFRTTNAHHRHNLFE
jgi:sulfur relay (sulfurtransferase) DsrC/TusE family protein